jgi:PAS domain S-box-containing protein
MDRSTTNDNSHPCTDLQRAIERLDSIFDAAPVGIGMVQDRVIRKVNPFFCHMMGYTSDELIGKDTRMLYPSDEEYERVGKTKYDAISRHGKGSIETQLVRKDGKILDILLTSVALDPSDISSGVTFTAMDITGQKWTEKALVDSKQGHRNLIETSPMGIFIYEVNEAGDLILIEANPATEHVLGFDTRSYFGKRLEDIFPNVIGTELPDKYKNAAVKGEIWSATDLYYNDDQIAGAYDFVAFQIAPGQVAVMFSDVTAQKQTEQKLLESEEKHRKIFHNMQDVYFEMAPDTTILEVSPSVSKISQYKREDLIGKSIDHLVVDEKIKDTFLKLLFEKGELKDFDVPLKDRDDRPLYCSVNIKIETGTDGTPLKAIGSLRDITERKLAREHISKLERAVEQSPSSVVITDLDGKIEYVNPRFTEITGYSKEEALGQRPSIMKSGEHAREFYKILWDSIRSGKEWRGEFYNRRKDGTTFWEMASISPVRNDMNQITHYIAIKDDITERKIIEQQLVVAKEKAEESDRLKSAFLANMSHEIRTPMNAILGFSELLQLEGIQPEQRQEYIKLINDKGNDLMNIISDLIDISRIEAGDMKLVKTHIQVNDLILEIFEQVKKEKDLKGKDEVQVRYRISEDTEYTILSDKNRLRQVFNNLLGNAMKFTNQGYIELGYDLIDDHVRFHVMDSGIGITPENQKLIFERFRQEDNSYTRKHGGTGLGLAISKQIVELLGGEISVESKPGQGAGFYFTLPLEKTAERLLSRSKVDRPPNQNNLKLATKKILIAEDDSSNYMFLESLLRPTDAELIWARNGLQAVEIHAGRNDIDLILMDIRLPEMNGLLATRKIRSTDQNIPIIALTAFAFADDREKSMEAGCTEHMSKPVKIEELKRVLQKYLG